MTAVHVDGAHGREVLRDDLRKGLAHKGASARWQIRPPGDTSLEAWCEATSDGLVVEPTARHPRTGEPCFPGSADDRGHLRWAALAATTASTGLLGFDAPADRWLVLEATLGARSFGLDAHPFDTEVVEPDRDPRLATGAFITLDRETGMVFDFVLANRCVYAVYERLRAEGPPGPAVSYAVPLAKRTPEQVHRCTIAYHRMDGVVHWRLDGAEVFTVDRIGARLADQQHRTTDDGSEDVTAAPRQLTVGFGLMADRTLGQGVRLTVADVVVREV